MRLWGEFFDGLPGLVVVALIAVLFAVIYGWRSAVEGSNDDILLLFVIPVVIAALRFGARGGLAAAALATGLMFLWDELRSDLDLEPVAYLNRALVFFPIGGVLGRFVSSRTSLLRRIVRAEELSLDMIATAGPDGCFKSLNPAWQRVLGHSEQDLLSRPFVQFVHPDDRAATERETAALVESGILAGFRNRYRAADGSYRWLEWNFRWSPEDSLIYAVARDVTIQRQAEELIQREAEQLEGIVRERTATLKDARLESLTRLALAAEYRDEDTHQHTERVAHHAELIAQELGLGEHFARNIQLAAPLHDVGKIGIPDHILLKPGKLTDQEFELMKTHTTIGAAILAGSQSELLRMGNQIALTHHERWDGSGYPAHLAGEAIPITGRIVAIADAFDAMTQSRPYKEAIPEQAALDELQRCAGTHFDPQIVQAFTQALSRELTPV
jgi:PAS domain S-box-containing protein